MKESRTNLSIKSIAEKPGSLLLSWLIEKQNNLGMSPKDLAKALNISYPYFYQLCSEKEVTKNCRRAGDEFIESAAEFLGLPKISRFDVILRIPHQVFKYQEIQFLRDLHRIIV